MHETPEDNPTIDNEEEGQEAVNDEGQHESEQEEDQAGEEPEQET